MSITTVLTKTTAAWFKSKETAAIKDASAYTWGIYIGSSPMVITSRKGAEYVLSKRDRFGARLSSTGKEIRFVFPKTDPYLTRVFTVDPATATRIYKKSVLVKGDWVIGSLN